MYDPTVGQFITEDPIGFDGKDTNLKRYVGNSPTNYTDPTGLSPFTDNLKELIGKSYDIWSNVKSYLFKKRTLSEEERFKVVSAALASFMSYDQDLDKAVMNKWGMEYLTGLSEGDENGLEWALYRRRAGSRDVFILAFTGTNEGKDWGSNGNNGIGVPGDTQQYGVGLMRISA